MKLINKVTLPCFILVMVLGCSIFFSGCNKKENNKKKIVIGLIAKNQTNPVFQATYTGAKDAAIELGKKYGIEVIVDWQTPTDENPQKQAEAIEQLARSGAAGIAVSCSDANILTSTIDKAINLGANVMCFDSDAPKSKRFAYYGTDDFECGRLVMKNLAEKMNNKGNIAILAGNQSAPNLQNRVKGVLEELKNHPDIKLIKNGIFYHPETPEQSAEAVNRAQTTNPQIEGWACVGGWHLFTKNALKWEPGKVKVVAVDALPPELDYLESGHVQVLLAQNCYSWGYKSVEILLDRIINKAKIENPVIIDQLTVVDKNNCAEYRNNWKKWIGTN
ncbi:MAG: substrate-binding domain-containing protein [bacterium]